MSRNLYDILQVSPSASAKEIKASFKRLAVKYHPDKNPGNALAEEKFKEVSHAYDVLSDPDQKAMYDLSLSGLDIFFTGGVQQKTGTVAERVRRAKEIKRKRKEAEIREVYKAITRRGKLTLHRAINGTLIALATWWIIEGWFHVVGDLHAEKFFYGIVLFIFACAGICSRQYKVLLYKNLEAPLGYDPSYRVFGRFFLYMGLCVTGSILLGQANGAAQFALFGERNSAVISYPAKSQVSGRSVYSLQHPYEATYYFDADGKRYVKSLPDDYWFLNIGDTITIEYSRLDPEIARIIPE